MRLLQIRFCKKFLGIFFFSDAVDTSIHKELKNKITTKFAAKDRICDSPKISIGYDKAFFKSSIKSSASSRPTDRRHIELLMPISSCCSEVKLE